MRATDKISLTRPDDWHLHLRDSAAMQAVIADSARVFARAIIMPNLRPPITTLAAALAYRQRILAALPTGLNFEPLMTLYLTENTEPAEIYQAQASGIVHAVKLYPAHATTNADAGVSNLKHCDAVFAAMQDCGLPLLVHAEIASAAVDVFDREAAFLWRHLTPLLERFPMLKVVVEHITTQDAVDFVLQASQQVAATITAHHLLLNRNALFTGGIRPHHYCLPVLKRERHRLAIIKAATSGNPKFFLGTDSAPHPRLAKESACGCAGIYTAHAALPLYAEAFATVGALDKLEGFASFYGADFYGLPRNSTRIFLHRRTWTVPNALPFGEDTLIPLRAGETVTWQVDDNIHF